MLLFFSFYLIIVQDSKYASGKSYKICFSGVNSVESTFLFISAQYLPTAGGVERFTFNLARKLLADGHHVIVATSSLPGQPTHEIDAYGIEVFRFPSWGFLNRRLPLLKPGIGFSKLSRLLWEKPIDYCVVNTYFYPLSMYAARQLHKRKIPGLILNHGSAFLLTGGKLVETMGRFYERTAVSLCHRYCPHFYGVSSAAADWMRTFSIVPEGIITNAVDPEELLSAVDPHVNWRSELGIGETGKIIAFVGRMLPEKGVPQLISAMDSIHETCPDCHLLLAGSGPLADQCADSLPEYIHLLGAQPHGKILALLKQADLFCLPSRSEGFACTVLEAAAMRCPILTTATGGSPQLLADETYGILLADMDPRTIYTACIQALNDPGWMKTAAENTAQRLCKNYTWDAAVRQLYQAFDIL